MVGGEAKVPRRPGDGWHEGSESMLDVVKPKYRDDPATGGTSVDEPIEAGKT